MQISSTQLVKSHADDLSLEYLRKGDEYGSLENSLKVMVKMEDNQKSYPQCML